MHNTISTHHQKILELLEKGFNSIEIAKNLNFSVGAIQCYLSKNSLKTINSLKNTPSKNKEKILEYLKLGKRPVEISKILNLHPVSVNSYCHYNLGYTFTYNHGDVDYFSKIDSPSKAYVLGYIAADGYIVRNFRGSNTKILGIQLNVCDIDFLYFLKGQIGCQNPVKILRNGKMARFTIANKKIIKDLETLGIVERKTFLLKDIPKNIPTKYQKYFIFGYFDGDGSFVKYKTRGKKDKNIFYNSCGGTISIRGTKDLLSSFPKILNIEHYNMSFNKTYIFSFSRKEYVKSFFEQYSKSPFFLKRKYEKIKSEYDKIVSKESKQV